MASKLSFLEMLQLAQEAEALFSELQKDGALDKIEAAFSAVESELHNPKATDLIGKLKQIFSKG